MKLRPSVQTERIAFDQCWRFVVIDLSDGLAKSELVTADAEVELSQVSEKWCEDAAVVASAGPAPER